MAPVADLGKILGGLKYKSKSKFIFIVLQYIKASPSSHIKPTEKPANQERDERPDRKKKGRLGRACLVAGVSHLGLGGCIFNLQTRLSSLSPMAENFREG